MKRKILILCLVGVALTFASFKKGNPSQKINAVSFFKAKHNVTEYAKGVPRVYVEYNYDDGNYYTTFGYGFGYGSMFTHPLTVMPGDNGQAWSPDTGFDGSYCGTDAYDYEQNGDSFSVKYIINPDYPEGSGKIETFTGHYVIDSNSPSNVSIIFDSDVITEVI